MALGFHFVDKIYTANEINQHIDLILKSNPPYINVLGGAQYKEALGFATYVQKNTNTDVIFRHYINNSDDGMHTRIGPEEWAENIARQYLPYDLIVLTDNESGASEYYAEWHAKAILRAKEIGVRIAFGRFSTHNPDRMLWPLLTPMFQAASEYSEGAIFSPNVYWSENPVNLDGIDHAIDLTRFGRSIAGSNMLCVIGEFGIAQNLDPHKGWKTTDMTGVEYINQAYLLHDYLLKHDIQSCLYCIGEWPIDKDTFSLDSDAIKQVIHLNGLERKGDNNMITFLPDDNRWKRARLFSNYSRTFVRKGPSTDTDVIYSIPGTGLDGFVIEEKDMSENEKDQSRDPLGFWIPVYFPEDDVIGFARNDVFSYMLEKTDEMFEIASEIKSEMMRLKIEAENIITRANETIALANELMKRLM